MPEGSREQRKDTLLPLGQKQKNTKGAPTGAFGVKGDVRMALECREKISIKGRMPGIRRYPAHYEKVVV